jgi:hypothetical protein
VKILGNTACEKVKKDKTRKRREVEGCGRYVLKKRTKYKEIGDSNVRAEEREINNRIPFSV